MIAYTANEFQMEVDLWEMAAAGSKARHPDDLHRPPLVQRQWRRPLQTQARVEAGPAARIAGIGRGD
ncbi:MAG: hypothetical protein MZV70_75665 [Desulfobacterales bacterium]|nr:hypothetical protein [Desulfobacterales bacterium]